MTIGHWEQAAAWAIGCLTVKAIAFPRHGYDEARPNAIAASEIVEAGCVDDGLLVVPMERTAGVDKVETKIGYGPDIGVCEDDGAPLPLWDVADIGVVSAGQSRVLNEATSFRCLQHAEPRPARRVEDPDGS
jgi:hypothetical protein